ncbi:PTS sugar transporter subunit IIA [Mycoplasmopsis ciconiae]|uniref:PTS sugar transporter subunit IIA n=1 Tax=Mycoplasmopsis ciconiae TaxID=561067 RepID=A0ABU7MNS9_9BACT|nr:PTS sugar transporter subunit IIA [Mycoplasmopsis ciconiae]
MYFFKLIDKKAIYLNSTATTKDEFLREISNNLHAQTYVENAEKFYQALLYREESMLTALNGGVALPHGVSSTVIKPVIAISVLKNQGVDWNAEDHQNVKVIFTIASNKENRDIQIECLQKVALYALENNFIDEILKANTPEDVLKALKQYYFDTQEDDDAEDI